MPEKLLIVDASLNKRIATELKARSRYAVALSQLRLRHTEDPAMLEELARRYAGRPWVFVTGDDNLPDEHGELVAELGITVAAVKQRIPQGWDEDAYERETVHRWAHVMARQPDGSVRRYTPDAHRRWAKARGKPRR